MSQMWQQWGGMMGGSGGMMGGGSGYPPTSGTMPFLWAIPVTLIGILLVGIAGVAYFYALPEMKTTRLNGNSVTANPAAQAALTTPPPNGSSNSPYESILKTATAE